MPTFPKREIFVEHFQAGNGTNLYVVRHPDGVRMASITDQGIADDMAKELNSLLVKYVDRHPNVVKIF